MKNNMIHSPANLFLIMVLLMCSLSSCNKVSSKSPSEAPTALVILIGNHANSKQHDVNIQEKVKEVYDGFGNINVIGIDGSPAVIRNAEGNIAGFLDNEEIRKSKQCRKKNREYWEMNILSKQMKEFMPVLDFPADDPEVDTLASLGVAVNALNLMEASMGKDIKKEIMICDTGLCTSGSLNFLNTEYFGFIKCGVKIQEHAEMKEKVDHFINKLYDQAEIPDLDGVTITWYGLGNVDDPQPPLSNLDIANLKYIWGEILRKSKAIPSLTGGADPEYGIFVSINADSTINYTQTVTPVIYWEGVGKNQDEEPSFEDEDEDKMIPQEEPPKLTEEKLGFLKESAEYRSEEEARNILSLYAGNLSNYPDMRILLVGTTADPNRNGGGKALSLERAQAVKNTLVSLGVAEYNIDIIGKGALSPWYKDEWEKGYFDEMIAKENRAVLILPSDSEMAKEVMEEN